MIVGEVSDEKQQLVADAYEALAIGIAAAKPGNTVGDIGHAIESFYLDSEDKESLKHGEAIAIGMVCESYISSKLLNLSEEKVSEVKELVNTTYDKIQIDQEDFNEIIGLLKHDKKNVNGNVNKHANKHVNKHVHC